MLWIHSTDHYPYGVELVTPNTDHCDSCRDTPSGAPIRKNQGAGNRLQKQYPSDFLRGVQLYNRLQIYAV